MEIPSIKIPTVAPITTPSVSKISVPAIPGTLNYYYQQMENANSQRGKYFFNYDKSHEVNSWADVISNTATRIYDSVVDANPIGMGLAVRDSIVDSFQLLHRGTLEPILNRDFSALVNNTWINFVETADLLDNVWKGFAIPVIQYNQGLSAGFDGVANVIRYRTNYDWDWGKGTAHDLLWEMATPTNLALLAGSLISGGATGAALAAKGVGVASKKAMLVGAKEGIEAVGPTVTRAAKRYISKNFGLVDTPILLKTLATKYNIPQYTLDLLEDIALHSTTMKSLASFNKYKTVVDVVDSFGPKIAFGHTFAPLRLSLAAGKKGITAYTQYAGELVRRNVESVNVMDFIGKQGNIQHTETLIDILSKTLSESFELNTMLDYAESLAHSDLAKIKAGFKKALQKAYKLDPDTLLLTDVPASLGDQLGKALDDAVKAVADTDFETYYNNVKRAVDGHPQGAAFTELYEQLTTMHKLRDSYKAGARSRKLYDLVEKYMNQITKDIQPIADPITLEQIRRAKQQQIDALSEHITEQMMYIRSAEAENLKVRSKPKLTRIERQQLIKRKAKALKGTPKQLKNTPVQHRGFVHMNSLINKVESDKLRLAQLEQDLVDVLKTLRIDNSKEAVANAHTYNIPAVIDMFEGWSKSTGYDSKKTKAIVKHGENLIKRIKGDGMPVTQQQLTTFLKRVKDTLEQEWYSVDNPDVVMKKAFDFFRPNADKLNAIERQLRNMAYSDDVFGLKPGSEMYKYMNDMVEQLKALDEDGLADAYKTMEALFDDFDTEVLDAFSTIDLNKLTNATEFFAKGADASEVFTGTLPEASLQEYAMHLGNIHKAHDAYTDVKVNQASNALVAQRRAEYIAAQKAMDLYLKNNPQGVKSIEGAALKVVGYDYNNTALIVEDFIVELRHLIETAKTKIRAAKLDKEAHLTAVSAQYDLFKTLQKFNNTLIRIVKDVKLIPQEVQDLLFRTQLFADNIVPPAKVVMDFTQDQLKEYVLQTSKFLKTQIILETPELIALVNTVENNMAQNSAIDLIRALAMSTRNDLAEDLVGLSESARYVMQTLEGFASLRRFYGDIYDSSLSTATKHSFVDALQSFYNLPANLSEGYTGTRDLWIDKIIKYTDTQIRLSQDPLKSAKLENLHKYLQEKIPSKYNTGTAHTAAQDARNVYLLEELEGIVSIGRSSIYEDIETTSFNKHAGTILQDAIFNPSTGITHVFINVGANQNSIVDDAVYHILAGDTDNAKTLDEVKEEFLRLYTRGDTSDLSIIEHFSDGGINKVTLCADEHALIRARNNLYQQLEDVTNDLETRFWNGDNFDIGFLNSKIDYYMDSSRNPMAETYRKLYDTNTVDSLKVYLDKTNTVRMTDQERDILEDLLLNYVSRRNAEPVQALGPVKLNLEEYATHSGRFIPSFDAKFRTDLDTIIDLLEGQNQVYKEHARKVMSRPDNIPKSIGFFDGDATLFGVDGRLSKLLDKDFQMLKDARKSISETLKLIKGWDISLAEIATDSDIMQHLINPKLLESIPEELRKTTNITRIMYNIFSEAGMDYPYFNMKLVKDPKLMRNWFATSNKKVGQATIRRLHKYASSLNKIADGVDRLDLLEEIPDVGQQLDTVIVNILNLLSRRTGTAKFYHSAVYLAQQETLLKKYAVAVRLWLDVTQNVPRLNGEFPPEIQRTLLGINSNLKQYITYHKSLQWRPNRASVLNDKHFHTLTYATEDMELVANHVKAQVNNEIKTIQQLVTLMDNGVQTAKLQRMVAVYEPLIRFEQNLHKLVETKALGDNRVKKAMYSSLRVMLESWDAMYRYQKVGQVLSYSPTDLKAYLWQHSLGSVIIDVSDLQSATYFRKRRGVVPVDVINKHLEFTEATQQMYEAAGIKVFTNGKQIILYLDEAGAKEAMKLPALSLGKDWVFDRDIIPKGLLQYMSKTEAKGLLEQAMDTRARILQLTNDGMTSTFERMDARVYAQIIGRVPEGVKLLDVVFLRNNARFNGDLFNHTVLGAIDNVRNYMPFASWNPIKRMFNATQLVQSKLSTQAQATELFFNSGSALKTYLESATPEAKEEAIAYLKERIGSIKVAFLTPHPRKGYVVKSVHLETVADLEFALKVNAHILDTNTFNKAYEIINENRIPEGWLKMLEKYLIVPYKIGVLGYNMAAVFRNIIDSSMKNLITTGDFKIIGETFEMLKHYMNFKRTTQQIYAYAKELGVNPAVAAEELFRLKKTHLDQYTFNLISKFIADGPSSGMVSEAKKALGDSVTKLYNRYGGEQSLYLKESVFREIMNAPSDVAEELINKYAINNHHSALLREIKQDVFVYKRAYAMNKLSTGKQFDTETLATYLKRPDKLPEELAVEFNRLLEATKDFEIKDTLYERLFNNAFVNNMLSINGSVEEIMRLTLYKHVLEEEGGSFSQAIGSVIRTHFDYGRRSQAMTYLEYIFPFSTFRLNNMIYWLEELGKHPQLVEGLSMYARGVSGQTNYTEEEMHYYKGLKYHVENGNIVLEELGMALKVNPSLFDTFQMAVNPIGYIGEGYNGIARALVEYFTMERYTKEKYEDFEERKNMKLMSIIPFFGAWYQRSQASLSDNPIINILFAPFISKVNMPKAPSRLKYRVPKKGYSYKRKYYGKRIYHKPSKLSTYHPFNRTYYGAISKARNNNVYLTKASRGGNQTFKYVKGAVTSKSGRPKYRFLAFPTNKWTMPIKIGILRSLGRHIQYQSNS